MTGETATLGYMYCVNNEGYPASLELGKSYEVVPDDDAEVDQLRIVDESGEDYLYPADFFSSEAPPQGVPELYEDVTREIRGFIEEHQGLLDEASPLVLGRVYTQGVRIFTTINDEVIEGANRATAAKNELAAAIRSSTTPPLRLQELEAEEVRASRVYQARMTASQELGDFLDRVRSRIPDEYMGEGD
jgi:hypothetical protein